MAADLLTEAISVADTFLTHGEIVSQRGREKTDIDRYYAESAVPGDLAKGLPIIVLTNAGTASASEIVAGALQDQHRAIVMGERTFGKGSVQTLIQLGPQTDLRLTTARYYTPSGRSVQEGGIQPDIAVPEISDPDYKDEPVLREVDLQRHLINELKADDAAIESDVKDDPRFAATPDELKKRGIDDFQLYYAAKTIARLGGPGGGRGTGQAAGGDADDARGEGAVTPCSADSFSDRAVDRAAAAAGADGGRARLAIYRRADPVRDVRMAALAALCGDCAGGAGVLRARGLTPIGERLVLLAALAIAISGAIGVYHAGVEYGWWEGATSCSTTVTGGGSADAMLAQIMAAPLIRCDQPQWTLFGVSLAGFNAILSLGGAAIVLILLGRGGRQNGMSGWRPGDPKRATDAMIRVDQAGEYGATRIYAGQLAVMGDRSPGARDRSPAWRGRRIATARSSTG